MKSTVQYFKVKNLDLKVAYRGGYHPRIKAAFRHFKFFYCYYTPENFGKVIFYSRILLYKIQPL